MIKHTYLLIHWFPNSQATGAGAMNLDASSKFIYGDGAMDIGEHRLLCIYAGNFRLDDNKKMQT